MNNISNDLAEVLDKYVGNMIPRMISDITDEVTKLLDDKYPGMYTVVVVEDGVDNLVCRLTEVSTGTVEPWGF